MSFDFLVSKIGDALSIIKNEKPFSSKWNKAMTKVSLAFLITGALIKKSNSLYQDHRLRSSPFQPRIIIIGAGMSGVIAAIRLKTKLNYHNFIIYDRDSDVGGTWHVNDYPGCCCDIPGLNYAFSFEKVPEWVPEYYPKRDETLAYIKHLCKKYELYKHIQFSSCVTKMVYDEIKREWNVNITNTSTPDTVITQTVTANIVIY